MTYVVVIEYRDRKEILEFETIDDVVKYVEGNEKVKKVRICLGEIVW